MWLDSIPVVLMKKEEFSRALFRYKENVGKQKGFYVDFQACGNI